MGSNVGTQQLLNASNVSSIPVAETAVVYTKAFKLSKGSFFALSYLATVAGAGTPDLKIELEQSWKLPETEGAADTYWAEPEGTSDIESSLTAETIKHKAISPVTMQYGRLKITGNASNPAGTVISAWVHQQEEA